jgi:hypothetical protein
MRREWDGRAAVLQVATLARGNGDLLPLWRPPSRNKKDDTREPYGPTRVHVRFVRRRNQAFLEAFFFVVRFLATLPAFFAAGFFALFVFVFFAAM